MRYYAGLDVSVKTTAVCVVDEHGKVVRERSLATEPESLADWLSKTGLPIDRVGHEAGPMSAWLHEGLAGKGVPIVCVEARHMQSALAAMRNKTDRNDACGIAQMMRTGWYRTVHVKSGRAQELRLLLVARQTLIDNRRNIENTIRGTLKVFGIKVGPVSRLRFCERVRELVCNRPEIAETIEALLKARDALMAQYHELHRRLKAIARADEVCRRLMSAPGVGPVVAVNFRAGVDAPERFARSSSVGAHFGMTPQRYASGETDRQGAISKCGDEMVRTALYEAANVLLTRTKRASGLKTWGLAIARRSCMAKAKVAVARKLSVILHRMWADGTEFCWGEGAPA
ncbi:MAG: IS110 family transposase [Alphaproteobacteria bacterium]|nr:IS110 family transposase [Alphaproteobacteria bacterium]